MLEDLAPGTHTLRVFASRPWHESFKNQGAYDQITFHIYAKTPVYNPERDRPLLTYSRPQGRYGAEPIMLDFYLTNVPLHLIAQEDAEDDIPDWRIRCGVNGQSFIFDQWQPIYLQGFKPGKNWVQLELIDEQGNPIPNTFNNTVRVIDYQPGGTDTLSQLVRGELTLAAVKGIVDPTYEPPAVPAAIAPAPEVPTAEPEPEVFPDTPKPEPPQVNPEPSEPLRTQPPAVAEPEESTTPFVDMSKTPLPAADIESPADFRPQPMPAEPPTSEPPALSPEQGQPAPELPVEEIPDTLTQPFPEAEVAPPKSSPVIEQPAKIPAETGKAPQSQESPDAVLQKPPDQNPKANMTAPTADSLPKSSIEPELPDPTEMPVEIIEGFPPDPLQSAVEQDQAAGLETDLPGSDSKKFFNRFRRLQQQIMKDKPAVAPTEQSGEPFPAPSPLEPPPDAVSSPEPTEQPVGLTTELTEN
ncbi:MAG: hypothetical protein HC886_18400 [Leptolyngbyaceae cyanobacterium SM1_1_3]|nr:hypothetical protein [Leptolyngbyaceae cyanobacterium SM1_1_3]